MSIVYKLENLTTGIVEKRPSQHCKTPYVADVSLDGTSVLVHTPALGCCGLCDKTATILMSPLENKKTKCAYRAEISVVYEPKIGRNIYIGTNPKLAETLIFECMKQDKLRFLKNRKSYKREVKIEDSNSRFDFAGLDKDSKPYLMEIKNVPLADYVDMSAKDKKKHDMSIYDDYEYNEKISYFPDGYRKLAKEPISPRALKHMNELAKIAEKYSIRCIMCYVIQRSDAKYFQPSVIDPHYREAFYEARKKGVEMYALQFEWNENGEAILYDKYMEIL